MIVSFIDQQADKFSEILGLSDDKIKLVFCLLLSYPFGFVFKIIHNTTLRYCIGTILGFFYQYLLFKEQVLHVLGLVLFTYTTVRFGGRNKAFLIFVIAMTYLSVFHIYRMYVDWRAWKMDISTILMIFVCKCTSFAWSYQDGATEQHLLSQEQLKRRIEKLPSLFEYLSFMYFYAAALVGPIYDYNNHVAFIKREGDYATTPDTFLPSFVYLLSGLVTLLFVVYMGPIYDPEMLISEEYASKSWLHKYLFLTVAIQVLRFKYFTAWLLATANVTAPGLNYNPEGKTIYQKYGRIVAARPIDHETADNLRDKIETWNVPIQLWLKNYIYCRVVPEHVKKSSPSKASYASNVTFMTSAFWHGFYPNYYVTFFMLFLLQQISKSLFKMRENLRWIPEPIGFILRIVITKFFVDFCAASFALLSLDEGLRFFRAWNFIPNILLGTAFLVLTFTNIGKKPNSRKTRNGEVIVNGKTQAKNKVEK